MEKKVTKKPSVKKTVQKAPAKKAATTTVKKKPVQAKKTTATAKKPAVKKAPVPKAETVKTEQVTERIIDNTSSIKCKHCQKIYDKDLAICPFCYKKQKDRTGTVIITILTVILFLSIIANHFVTKYYDDQVSESDYKYNCNLVSYEDLVRNPKDYKNQNVKVIGKILTVEGNDSYFGNIMKITMDANLFNGDNEQIVEFEYVDNKYETGFIEGDIITIYGEYKTINGNVPFIDAKYIVFGT